MQASRVLPARQRIGAYHTSVDGKLGRSLEQIYPVRHRLVGENFVQAMASAILEHGVSRSPGLGDYGAAFPAFLSTFRPVQSLAYLTDVARLEWLWHRAFNAPDQPRLNLEALARVPPEHWDRLVFRLPAGAALIASDYPIHRIWEINTIPTPSHDVIDLDQGGIRILVWGDGHSTRLDLPSETGWQLLQAFASGVPFGELCRQDFDHSGTTMAELLPVWVQCGWLRDFVLQEEVDP
ncbi:putative DNA-binding domain-containing protein [Cyanobium sp. Cruz-8D1]|uniref:HvfC/BufC family peptide modification chaperone n=1 Tax=Cyanobium sp. Cruz-8D1 TaxID=2823711 RepID=UPI0037BF0C0D